MRTWQKNRRQLIEKTLAGKFSCSHRTVGRLINETRIAWDDAPQARGYTARGARINPSKNPAINPHRCAAMLTCGVERSNAI